MTALQHKPHNQTDHLLPEDVEEIGRLLDRVREDVLGTLGEKDAAYIRRVIRTQRLLELGGRVVLLAGRWRPAWVVGTASLTVAKILDNMEIGHNVLHGQWDWMRDPKIHSTTWDWDYASPTGQWQRAHNVQHHTYTNILGKDNDLGYGILRVDEEQTWEPRHLVQPLWNLVNALVFEYGIALYDLGFGDSLRSRSGFSAEQRRDLRQLLSKVRRQVTKDFVIHPLLAGPGWRATLTANLVANVTRNVWSHSVIMCGHFPEGVETFDQQSLPSDETRGAVVPAPDARLGQHHRISCPAPDGRQPVSPDRAPPLPRPAQQPLPHHRPDGARRVRAVRPELPRCTHGPAGRQRVAQGAPSVAAERPRRQRWTPYAASSRPARPRPRPDHTIGDAGPGAHHRGRSCALGWSHDGRTEREERRAARNAPARGARGGHGR